MVTLSRLFFYRGIKKAWNPLFLIGAPHKGLALPWSMQGPRTWLPAQGPSSRSGNSMDNLGSPHVQVGTPGCSPLSPLRWALAKSPRTYLPLASKSGNHPHSEGSRKTYKPHTWCAQAPGARGMQILLQTLVTTKSNVLRGASSHKN